MLYIFLVIFVVVLDQLSKYLVIQNIPVNGTLEIISNFFNLTYVRNTGVAFSLFSDNTFIIIIFDILLSIGLIYMLIKETDKFTKIIYSLIIGGAIGNLIDRIIYKYVVDFLSFTIFGSPFAIFNIADSFITVSVFLLLIKEFVGYFNAKNKSNS